LQLGAGGLDLLGAEALAQLIELRCGLVALRLRAREQVREAVTLGLGDDAFRVQRAMRSYSRLCIVSSASAAAVASA
jgi:hypothetical protein